MNKPQPTNQPTNPQSQKLVLSLPTISRCSARATTHDMFGPVETGSKTANTKKTTKLGTILLEPVSLDTLSHRHIVVRSIRQEDKTNKMRRSI